MAGADHTMRKCSIAVFLLYASVNFAAVAAPHSQAESCPAATNPVTEAIERNRPSFARLSCIQKLFIEAYTARLDGPANPLDDLAGFIDLIEGRDPSSCNLLCRQGLVPRFWLSGPATAVDLIRYVFTNTCYGVSGQYQARALADLNAVLGRLHTIETSYAELLGSPNIAEKDREFVRGQLGDIQSVHDPDFSNITRPKFDNVKSLWQHAAVRPTRPALPSLRPRERFAAPHRKPLELSAEQKSAIHDACSTSYAHRIK
jgi:hypothetical protein